ncbi:MAG: polyprenyl synthetase family protein [Pseudomonadales bacterium]
MDAIRNAVANDFDAVNQLIIDELHSDVGLVESIGHYIVDAGGKRMRPILVLLSAMAHGYQGKQHIELAAVIEFIHTATLLHDDVVDISSLRRGRPTANAEWGNAPSVLVGDFIYSRAFQLLVRIGHMDIMQLTANTTNRIAEGEVLQLEMAGKPDTTESTYHQIIERKTAILFEAATRGGAILANSSEPECIRAGAYGHNLGMAFQLIDDVLDYRGDAATMGKNLGDDLAEGKPTLPLIFTMREGSQQQRDLVTHAISNKTAENLDQILTAVNETGALDYTEQQAIEHQSLALAALSELPANNYRTQMERLAVLAVKRDH